jgi:acetyl-CoA carboxylase carboxyl transferase subunit beta
MSWLTNFVRPTLKRLIAPRVLRETQWITCPNCGATIFHKDLDTNWRICPHCDHHLTLAAARRFALLLDQDKWSRIEAPSAVVDPLKFRDSKRYSDRLREAEEFSQENESIVVAHGKLDDIRVVIAACEPHFLSGTLGAAAGEALIAAAELAILQDAPLIFVTGSHGPRLQEGAFALMQLPRVNLAFRKVTESGLPLITVLADPVFDPTSDVLAQQSDIVIAEPGARIGPPPPNPMAPMDTPESLQDRDGVLSTTSAMDHGRIDRIVDRRDLKSEISAILTLLQSPFPIAQVLTYPGPAAADTTEIDTPEPDDGEHND